MKRLLIIGFTGCAFALAPIISASAMPAATPYTMGGPDGAVIQVKGGHGHATRAWVGPSRRSRPPLRLAPWPSLWLAASSSLVVNRQKERGRISWRPATAVRFVPGLRLPSAVVVERHKPSYRSVTPLDARRLPTFN